MTNQLGELLQEQIQHKWITAPDQHADHAGQTLLTRERTVIRAWAAARKAEPATGVGRVDINDGGAAIRFAFPGVGRLQPISWDDWFQNFEEWNLVFVFEEESDEGLQSCKYRLVRTEHLPQYGAGDAPAAGESRKRKMNGESASPRRRVDDHPPARRGTPWRRVLNIFGTRRSRP